MTWLRRLWLWLIPTDALLKEIYHRYGTREDRTD